MSDTCTIWKDNSCINNLTTSQEQAVKFLEGKDLNSLLKDNRDLIVFPKTNQDILKSAIFTRRYDSDTRDFKIWTTNLMGVLNYTNESLSCPVTISVGSRFDVDTNNKPNVKQPFLTYLLSEVFEGLVVSPNVDAIPYVLWDLLLVFLFTYHLKQSYRRGLFKQYVHSEYNERCFKGSLDVGRHLKNNTPFMGKIGYNIEEFSYDNPILWLVRHAANSLRTRHADLLTAVTNKCNTVIEAIRAISEATPSYSPQRRYQLYHKCRIPIRHPFFSEYEDLRKTCLQISRREGVTPYAVGKEEVYGVLFDGAWLWEQFVAKLLAEPKMGFKHHVYGRKEDAILVFEGDTYPFYPDFTKGNAVVLDAKYKPYKPDKEKWNRDDVHQILSYMYLTGANIGGVIYPASAGTNWEIKPFYTRDYKGRWLNIPLRIPSCGDKFRAQMDANVQEWKADVRQWLEKAK